MGRGAIVDWQLAPRAGFCALSRAGVHEGVTVRSRWQVIFAGPQAHVAVTRCSVAHGASEALAGALCPFASANPTDMAVASNAMANVLSMVSSSLKLGSETIFEAT